MEISGVNLSRSLISKENASNILQPEWHGIPFI